MKDTKTDTKNRRSSKLYWPILLSESFDISSNRKEENTEFIHGFFRVVSSPYALEKIAEITLSNKLGGIILYEKPKKRSEDAKSLTDEHSSTAETLRFFKDNYPSIQIITDLCVCQHTEEGHCRLRNKNGELSESVTQQHVNRAAALYTECGAHSIMPSGMLPFCSHKLRAYLKPQCSIVPKIISQSSKFQSHLYSPFRNTLCMSKAVDKTSYQTAPYDTEKAAALLLREAEAFEGQKGADSILIKPTMPYTELLREIKSQIPLPCGTFLTSGEHALLLQYGERSNENEKHKPLLTFIETLLNLESDMVVTYQAPLIASHLR